MWQYGQNTTDWDDRMVGYEVEAADGGIGKVDKANAETNSQSIVVDTGPWIFGQRVMLPAGLIRNVDHEGQKVYVSATKEQIKNAPQLDETDDASAYQDKLGGYYTS